MQSSPAKRCQHIHTRGTQCGSPALRDKKFCYYHLQSPPYDVKTYGDWDDSCPTGEIRLPPFEDAYSIQFVIRQVTQLLLQKGIDHKTAGLLLYSLQIASSNLKRMTDEKPQQSQIVVDLDKVAETPLPTEPNSNAEAREANSQSSNQKPRHKKKDNGEPSEEEIQHQMDYLLALGNHLDDPAGSVPDLDRLKKLAEGNPEDIADGDLPPGTIQACETRPRYVN